MSIRITRSITTGALAAVLLAASACTTGGGGGTPPNIAPVASATASPTSGSAPLTVAFDGSASTDSDGTLINYSWDFGDGTAGSGITTSHVYATGTYTAQLLVTDNLGAFGSTSIVITATNVAPVSSFTATPSSGAAPLTVALNAAASNDPDGSITSYAWDFGDGTTATGVTSSHTYPAGVFSVSLVVTDNNGLSATSTRSVSVTGSPAAPTGLRKTGSGCCNTYGDFAWNPVVGADAFEIDMNSFFGGGCLVDASAVVAGPTTGRVQAALLCLGSKYDVKIRSRANGTWGAWSGTIRITL